MASNQTDRGFTLVETVVATGLLVTALAGVAQLFVLGTQLTRQAGAAGVALLAAQEKLESLRASAFSYDGMGVPITSPHLAPSPPTSLDEDVAAHVDWLDSSGQPRDRGSAAFVRRWRISAMGSVGPDAIAIEVCVFRAPVGGRDHRSADACLSTIRTRQP